MKPPKCDSFLRNLEFKPPQHIVVENSIDFVSGYDYTISD